MYPVEKRTELRKLYIYTQLSLVAAAKQVGIHLRTAHKWKKEDFSNGDDWDQRRVVARSNERDVGREIREDFMVLSQQIKEMMEQERVRGESDVDKNISRLASLADSCSKMIAASNKLNPNMVRLDVANHVIKLLEDFVRKEHPECLECFSKILLPFSSFLVKKMKN